MQSSRPPTQNPPVQRSIEELENELTTIAAHQHAADYRMMIVLEELDRRENFGAWGMPSTAYWLQWKCGYSLNSAHERVRVARALPHLPKISDAFRKGELSYSKVRAISRVATENNEEYLLYIAHAGTTSHVEKLVRQYRSVKQRESNVDAMRAHEQREVVWYTERDGTVVGRFRLPADDAAVVIAALEAAAKQVTADRSANVRVATEAGEPEKQLEEVLNQDLDFSREKLKGERSDPTRPYIDEEPTNYWANRADGLVAMAQSFLSQGFPNQSNSGEPIHGAELSHLTLHLDEKSLVRPEVGGRSSIRAGDDYDFESQLGFDTARRLTCDCSRSCLHHGANGEILKSGRRVRQMSAALRRALYERDQRCCQFPGCGRRKWLHAHHIEHWADGGETSLSNLTILCSYHHRLVHEGGFDVYVGAEGERIFTRPNGRVVPTTPAKPIDPDAWLLDLMRLNNVDLSLGIDATTTIPTWSGEVMDYGMALHSLQHIDEHGPENGA